MTRMYQDAGGIVRSAALVTEIATQTADQVVPAYRSGKPKSCTGHVANRWQAAWDAACLVLGGNPEEFRR